MGKERFLNMGKATIKYELILLFERFDFTPKVMCQKLKSLGYKERTIYRYYNHWLEASNSVKVIQKGL